MRVFRSSAVLSVLALLAGTMGLAGAAWAVSGGGYNPGQQDCPANASRNNAPKGYVSPGCHNFAVNFEGSKGTRYAEVGLDQLPNGYPSTPGLVGLGYPGSPNSVHSGCAAVNTNGTGGGTGTGCGAGKGLGTTIVFDTQNTKRNSVSVQKGTPSTAALMSLLTNGFQLYLGADDNLDAGEHDGVSGNNGTIGAVNGPSDGGGVGVFFLPARASQSPTAYDPVPLAGASEGFCADGFCQEATTHRQVVYQGCGANKYVACSPGSKNSRDVYNYSGKQWDPYNCSSGDTVSEAPGPNGCGTSTMDQWRAREARNVYAEPGFQFYEDPDPQGSPAGPIYPLPVIYVGTCGVVLGGGQVTAPSSPVTNNAGQVVVAPTGC
jgi:hypothetical protein